MGGLQRQSVSSCPQICVCTIWLFYTSATQDGHNPTHVTLVHRIHMEPVVCT